MNIEIFNALLKVARENNHKLTAFFIDGDKTVQKEVESMEWENHGTYERWEQTQSYHEYTLKFTDGTIGEFDSERRWCDLNLEKKQ